MIPPAECRSGWDASAVGSGPGTREGARGRVRPDAVTVIIGGGVAGCSLAFSLARAGQPALLLEAGEVGRQGASAVGAALLNPHRGRSGKPGRFDLEGLEEFWSLSSVLRSLGEDPGEHRSGVLRMASNERQARAWRELPGLEPLEVTPGPYRAPHGAFLIRSAGWVEPARLLAALRNASEGLGGEFREQWLVERIERAGGRWLVHGPADSIRASRVILCPGAGVSAGTMTGRAGDSGGGSLGDAMAGSWPGTSVSGAAGTTGGSAGTTGGSAGTLPAIDAGVELPVLEYVAGDQVVLQANVTLPYPVAGPVYFAGIGGEVLVGGNHRQAGTSDPRAGLLLRRSAARLVPALAEAPISRVWTGVRAKQPDNLPVMKELQPRLWYLGAFGGRGFLTAPLLARRLTEALLSSD